MSTERALWVIISPVYKPAPGGGAVYNDILVRALAEAGEDVLLIVEKFPGMPDEEQLETTSGYATIRRLFPYRAGRSSRDLRSYFDYLVQNIQMVALPGVIRRACCTRKLKRAIIVVHSSFFYNPSVLPRLVDRLKAAAPEHAALVLDVRDPVFSDDLFPLFRRFDSAIGCSRQISDRLTGSLEGDVHVQHIPIPFEQGPRPDGGTIEKTLGKYGLEGIRYILNPHGILNAKGYPLMLETIRALRRIEGYGDVRLVTIGRSRDWSERDAAAESDGLLRYVGPVSNEEALHIASGGLMTMILSKNEGLPRSALESIALGQKVIVPALPEFADTIPSNIAASDDPDELAHQIVGLLAQSEPTDYPIERHSMANLISLYRAFARFQ